MLQFDKFYEMREQDTTYVSKLIWKKNNQNLRIYCFFSLLLQDTNYFYRQITTTRKLLPLLNFYHKRTWRWEYFCLQVVLQICPAMKDLNIFHIDGKIIRGRESAHRKHGQCKAVWGATWKNLHWPVTLLPCCLLPCCLVAWCLLSRLSRGTHMIVKPDLS